MSLLNPKKILSELSNLVNEYSNIDESMSEVEMRRIFSTLYFSLFNYWSEIYYNKLHKRGGGINGDRFSHKEFSRYIIRNNLSMEYVLLFTFRVFSDHYLLNPNTIEISDHEVNSLIDGTQSINMSFENVKEALNCADSIFHFLITMV